MRLPFGAISIDPLRVEVAHGPCSRLGLRGPRLTREAQPPARDEPNEGHSSDQRPEACENRYHAGTNAARRTTGRALWQAIGRPAARPVSAPRPNLRSFLRSGLGRGSPLLDSASKHRVELLTLL